MSLTESQKTAAREAWTLEGACREPVDEWEYLQAYAVYAAGMQEGRAGPVAASPSLPVEPDALTPEIEAQIIAAVKKAYGDEMMYSEVTLGQRAAFAIGYRTAISAVERQGDAIPREPTPQMMLAGYKILHGPGHKERTHIDAWRAMYDAAIRSATKEKP